MPAATEYRPDDKDLRNAAHDELCARRDAYTLALAYYDRQHKKNLKSKKGEPDDNVVINLVKQTVDREVSFLFPKMVGLELSMLDDTDAEIWLREAWEETGGARLLRKLAKNGSLGGHVFAKIIPADGQRYLYPRVVALNPANVVVFWQADDVENVLWYEIHWTVGKTAYRQDVINRGMFWEICEFSRETSNGGMVGNWIPDNSKFAVWSYPLGPIVDWPHIEHPGSYYGANENLIDLNDQVNKKASDISRILRYHAGPRTIGTGFEAEEVTETGIDNFWTIDNAEAKVYNLEMQTDLASSMNYLEFLQSAYYAEKRITVLKGNAADFQRVTNMGVRTIFIDQLAKNDELHLQYRSGIVGISQRLRMLQPAGDYRSPVKVTFYDPLPVDPAEQVNVLEKERQMEIVSKETAAIERGRDWAQELERMADEADAAATPMERILQRDLRDVMQPGSDMLGANQ